MADVFDCKKRSEVMAKIRSKGNKDTELVLVRILRSHRLTGWRRHLPLTGHPDFVFQKERAVVFVDGCFWHNCPKHGRKPGSNKTYWTKKIARNKARDREVVRFLKMEGWRVLRIWEHELNQAQRIASRIQKRLDLQKQ